MISPRLQLFLSILNQTAYNEQLLFFLSHLPHTTRNFTPMRRFYFTLLGVLSVFLLSLLCPSCRPQSDVEEATLELSATALTLPREGTAQTLTITTNQSSWSAFSPQEATWITLRQEGNTLYVGAQANASGQERTGAVLVQAGGQQRRVTVHQTAADVLLEAPESVVLQAEGGSSEVSFECNSDALTIELAEGAGWLRVDKRTAKTFTLVAEANADKHNRTAKITLTAGTVVRELEVTQLGLTPYIFPMSMSEAIRSSTPVRRRRSSTPASASSPRVRSCHSSSTSSVRRIALASLSLPSSIRIRTSSRGTRTLTKP